jgi:hypothetical protein
MDIRRLSEQDIRTKYITPAIVSAGWDIRTQLREEVTLTAGYPRRTGETGTLAPYAYRYPEHTHRSPPTPGGPPR